MDTEKKLSNLRINFYIDIVMIVLLILYMIDYHRLVLTEYETPGGHL